VHEVISTSNNKFLLCRLVLAVEGAGCISLAGRGCREGRSQVAAFKASVYLFFGLFLAPPSRATTGRRLILFRSPWWPTDQVASNQSLLNKLARCWVALWRVDLPLFLAGHHGDGGEAQVVDSQGRATRWGSLAAAFLCAYSRW